ncbi:MAG: type II toxin-antitoxin system RelE/ParE family toxin [Acidobacteria bacterium]|jgi:plasmid stabilization system protein ParE|nr:type II toxin-antitoxin system RelE/ParE family toxin [Acidobacteriota bacterium]
MARKVVWSLEAIEDVESIAHYIMRDSPAYAASVVENILAMARGLGDFPFSGRVVPEWGDEMVRERFVYSYRMIYQIQAETITVVTIIHGRRLLEP